MAEFVLNMAIPCGLSECSAAYWLVRFAGRGAVPFFAAGAPVWEMMTSMMLDHIGFPVSDYARSKAFYLAALAPLGYGLVMEFTPEATGGEVSVAGLGTADKPAFWISTGTPLQGSLHVAFVAKTRADVDAFYRAAIAAGGVDNGPPGLRPQYHPAYYGAFVRDPDGHNIEAVCHCSEG